MMYEKYVYSTAANSSSIIKKFSFQLLDCMYELEEKIVIFELCYCYRKKQLHSENRKTHQFLRECQGVNLLNSYEIPLLRGAVRKMRGVSVARGKRKKKWERETTREIQSVAGASRRVFEKIGRFVSWQGSVTTALCIRIKSSLFRRMGWKGDTTRAWKLRNAWRGCNVIRERATSPRAS